MFPFAEEMLSRPRPARVREIVLPRRAEYFPSPVDWQDEVLYFLFVDRFSDGREQERPLLDRRRIPAARGDGWSFAAWADSGGNRWQGGNLRGVISKLDYLEQLGITALWLSPVFKQRGHENNYHGYAVQDFLEVDPHFGNRADLVELVSRAHERKMRVLLDVVFQHSGNNWLYPLGTPGGPHEPLYTSGRYPFGAWRGDEGQRLEAIRTPEDGVWPVELQDPECYTRAGSGNLGAGDINDPHWPSTSAATFLRCATSPWDNPVFSTTWRDVSNIGLPSPTWTGCVIDTLKHVSLAEARAFCGTLKEFAANLGKHNFFLVGEVAGGDFTADRYLDVLQAELNAALDIGETRLALGNVAKGLAPPSAYFDGFDPGLAIMGSHRNFGTRHVSVCDDHDHVFGPKLRFSSDASSEHQVVAAVAIQLFTLGIPCIYYGTEQAFAGPRERRTPMAPLLGRGRSLPARSDVRSSAPPRQRPRRASAGGRRHGASWLRTVRHRGAPLLRRGPPRLRADESDAGHPCRVPRPPPRPTIFATHVDRGLTVRTCGRRRDPAVVPHSRRRRSGVHRQYARRKTSGGDVVIDAVDERPRRAVPRPR